MAHNQLTHIIHRQVFDLTIRSNAEESEITDRLKNAFYGTLPRLESVFSLYDDPDLLIRFDKISLDLGVFKPEMIGDVFSSRLCDRLIEVLRDSVRDDVSEKTGMRKQRYNNLTEYDNKTETRDSDVLADLEGLNKPVLFSDLTLAPPVISKPEYYSVAESTRMAFFYFLTHGDLPWYSGKPAEEDSGSVFHFLLKNPDDSFVDELKKFLHDDNNALRRLLYQFPEKYTKELLKLLLQNADQEIVKLYEIVKQQDFLRTKPVVSLEMSYNQAKWLSFQILISETAAEVVNRLAQIILSDNSSSEAISKLIRTDPWAAFQQMVQARKDSVIPDSHALDIYKSSVIQEEDHHNSVSASEQDLIPDSSADIDKDGVESVDKSIFVDYAGLVILHPFLPQFFKGLGLLNEKDQFKNVGSRTKALHLLAFLANGKISAFEPELLFCKFLCGMPLKKAIAKITSYSKNEIEECEQLLNDVISHWPVLKNTSIEGLREGFLNRKGKLDFRDEIAVLYVETMSRDILLEMLPWGIGFVQLPWMDTPFTTIWN
jgi:hypothetical protein